MTSEPRTMGAPADWRSEVESVRRMVDGIRTERQEARALIAALVSMAVPLTAEDRALVARAREEVVHG